MKHLSIIVAFFTILCFSQNPKANDNSILKEELKSTKEIPTENNLILENEILKQQNKILEERISQASDTISNQNSMFSGFSIIYTIITIIIALLGITLPILTYLFGIRPSQKALSEFEKNIDKKLEKYLIKTRNKQIDQAIENLTSEDSELKISAINFLNITNHQGFNDIQISKLFQLLKTDKLENQKKTILANLLSSKKHELATEYFTEALNKNDINVKYASIRYFANIGIEKSIGMFRNFLKKATDQNSEFYQILAYSNLADKKAVKFLINDTEFIDLLNNQTIEIYKSSMKSYISSLDLTDEEYKTSYLYKKLHN